MGKLLKNLVLATSIFVASSVFAAEPEIKSTNKWRFNPSISYGENMRFPNGALENYDPLRLRFGFELDADDHWFFNKYTFTPFIGKVHKDYDAGFIVGLKKIFLEGKSVKPFTEIGLGGIYIWKDLQEHRRRLNFYLNFEVGLETELWKDFALTTSMGYGHVSTGKKIKNNVLNTTGKGDNEGNPGLNNRYVSAGVIWKFKYFFEK